MVTTGWEISVHIFTAQHVTLQSTKRKSIQRLISETFFAQSVVFAHRRWVASWPWQELGCSLHLQAQRDLLFTTDILLSVTDEGRQQWVTDRQTGTCKHAEHCTLFWHNRNACFPTQAHTSNMFTQLFCQMITGEAYMIIHQCDQKISTPMFLCKTTTSQETWWHDLAASIKGKDCVLLEQRYPASLLGPYAVCETGHRVKADPLQPIRFYSLRHIKKLLKNLMGLHVIVLLIYVYMTHIWTCRGFIFFPDVSSAGHCSHVQGISE